ncbi:MAG: PfkB family carbohydrate kinase [Promethearchaeota archaeon]
MRQRNSFDCSLDTISDLRGSFVGHEVQLAERLGSKRVLVGWDGYVDKLCSLVAQRESPRDFTKMDSMNSFAERVGSTSGSSCNVERVLKKLIAGGFAPNVARALSHLGASVDLVAMMGFPEPLPLFRDFPQNVALHTIGDPGETIALEFNDGKVMLTDFGNINDLSWEQVASNLGRETMMSLFEGCEAIGQGHWSLVPNMNDIWTKIQEEVVPNLSNGAVKRWILLVDPADMKKRKKADILGMVEGLQKFEDLGIKTCLSLNDKEAVDLSEALDSVEVIAKREDYDDAGKRINEVIDLSYLVIHDPHFATVTTRSDHSFVQEGFTSRPKFTTAAGDHFNGGLLVGLLLGFRPAEAIAIANAVTAIFVRTGSSPDLVDTGRFLANYEEFVDDDVDHWPI